MTERICLVPEGGKPCGKPTRTAQAEWCKKHYHRQYRHGNVERVATGITTGHGRKYRSLYLPNHPLAPQSGKVYAHRAVLYDLIGPGAHPCHWCGTRVHWTVGIKAAGMLVPDHLDGHGDNNDPANLVPSCMPCNSDRGRQLRAAELAKRGWWSNHDTIAKLKAADCNRGRR